MSSAPGHYSPVSRPPLRPLHPRDSPPGLDFSATTLIFLSLLFSLHNLLTLACVLNNKYSYTRASGVSMRLHVPFTHKAHISYVLLYAHRKAGEPLFERPRKTCCEEEKRKQDLQITVKNAMVETGSHCQTRYTIAKLKTSAGPTGIDTVLPPVMTLLVQRVNDASLDADTSLGADTKPRGRCHHRDNICPEL